MPYPVTRLPAAVQAAASGQENAAGGWLDPPPRRDGHADGRHRDQQTHPRAQRALRAGQPARPGQPVPSPQLKPAGTRQRAGQGTPGQYRERRADRQQVLKTLERPQGEKQHRHDEPGEQQAFPPGGLPAQPDETGQGRHQQRRADPGRQHREVEEGRVIRTAEHLPEQIALAGPGMPGQPDHQRPDRYLRGQQQEGQEQVPDPHPRGRGEDEKRVEAAQQDDARLLGQDRGAHHAGPRQQPAEPSGLHIPDHAVERRGRAQGHQPVEQDLPAHHDVVWHDRDQQRGNQAGPGAVEPAPEQVRHAHGGDADGGREPPGRPVRVVHSQHHGQQRLEEQGVRAEHREHRAQRVVAGDGPGRTGVHRLVTVEADGGQLPEAQEYREHHDGCQRQHRERQPATVQPVAGPGPAAAGTVITGTGAVPGSAEPGGSPGAGSRDATSGPLPGSPPAAPTAWCELTQPPRRRAHRPTAATRRSGHGPAAIR